MDERDRFDTLLSYLETLGSQPSAKPWLAELHAEASALRLDLTRAREAQGELLVARDIAYADGWRAAVVCARQGARLFPPDTKESLHRFGADTVMKAVERGAVEAGVRMLNEAGDIIPSALSTTQAELAEARANIETLEGALRVIVNDLTCGEDDTHYCSRCDNGLYKLHAFAARALNGASHDQG